MTRLTLSKPMEIDGKVYLVEKVKCSHPKKEVDLIWLMESVSGAQKQRLSVFAGGIETELIDYLKQRL